MNEMFSSYENDDRVNNIPILNPLWYCDDFQDIQVAAVNAMIL